MRRLSLLIFLVGIFQVSFSQSPHGKDFQIDCAACHSPESWELLQLHKTFDHNQTSFKLEGVHRLVECKNCHKSLVFSEAESECIACHLDMHNNTLGSDCRRCHNPQNWIVVNISQLHREGRFPLTGAHRTTDCFQCHQSASNLQFEPLSIACINCHQNDYLATTSPNHQETGYSTNCVDCHGAQAASWYAANFEHNFFPLNGGHAISCFECHSGGTFNKLPTECIACHQDDYNETTDPNHQQVGFSTNCVECHQPSDRNWDAADFDHSAFPLTGGHASVSCAQCHTEGTGTKPSTDCFACHANDYNSTTDPNHQQVGFSTNCIECHQSANQSWDAATFGHSSFPLTGGHATVSCAQCHTEGTGAKPSTDCFACHQNDYNSTTDPNHQQVGFSTVCTQCHNTDPGWQAADYRLHDSQYFPIYSGRHNGQWNSCLDCHNNNASYADFTCFSCHEHNQTETDSHHQEVPNYTYQSSACYSCHPTGNAGD